MSPFALLVPVLVVVVAALVALPPGKYRVTERDLAWIAGTDVVPAPEAAVYAAYLLRHRRHRFVGGLFGGLLAAVVGIRYYRDVSLVGVGSTSPLADIFFGVVTGVVLGALSAETYRLGQPRTGAAVASLAPRAPVGLPRVVTGARVLAGASLLWGLLALVLLGPGAGPVLAVAVLGAVIGGVVELTRAAVANRRRPAESARALEVDARIRTFAGRTLSWLQAAVATLVATWVLALTPLRPVSEGLEALLALLVLAGLVATVVLLFRAAPRPPRSWRPAGLVEAA